VRQSRRRDESPGLLHGVMSQGGIASMAS